MHEKHGYIGSALTAWFANLTLTTQDVIAVAGLLLSAAFTVWTFFSNRSEQKKRTAILDQLALKLTQQNAPPSTLAAVAKIMKVDVPAVDLKEAAKEVVKDASE
jgi:hypothetical protein